MDSVESSSISQQVTDMLLYWLNRIGLYADYNTFHHFVRKLAHFTEFAGLGFIVALAVGIAPVFKYRFLNFIAFMIGVPFADEAFQYFIDGRNNSLTDVTIDASGYFFGGLLGYMLLLIIKEFYHYLKKKQKAK